MWGRGGGGFFSWPPHLGGGGIFFFPPPFRGGDIGGCNPKEGVYYSHNYWGGVPLSKGGGVIFLHTWGGGGGILWGGGGGGVKGLGRGGVLGERGGDW